MVVAVQESDEGVYRPPVLRLLPSLPPHTIISVPVQTVVWKYRGSGIYQSAFHESGLVGSARGPAGAMEFSVYSPLMAGSSVIRPKLTGQK